MNWLIVWVVLVSRRTHQSVIIALVWSSWFFSLWSFHFFSFFRWILISFSNSIRPQKPFFYYFDARKEPHTDAKKIRPSVDMALCLCGHFECDSHNRVLGAHLLCSNGKFDLFIFCLLYYFRSIAIYQFIYLIFRCCYWTYCEPSFRK